MLNIINKSYEFKRDLEEIYIKKILGNLICCGEKNEKDTILKSQLYHSSAWKNTISKIYADSNNLLNLICCKCYSIILRYLNHFDFIPLRIVETEHFSPKIRLISGADNSGFSSNRSLFDLYRLQLKHEVENFAPLSGK